MIKCHCFNIILYWLYSKLLQILSTSRGKICQSLAAWNYFDTVVQRCPALWVSVELKGCHLKLSEMVIAGPCWPLSLKNEHKLAKGLELTAVVVRWGSKSNTMQWQNAGLAWSSKASNQNAKNRGYGRWHPRGVPRCSFQSRWHNYAQFKFRRHALGHRTASVCIHTPMSWYVMHLWKTARSHQPQAARSSQTHPFPNSLIQRP